MDSCFWRQIVTVPSVCLSRNWDSSDQATFFQSSTVQFRWALQLLPQLSVLGLQKRNPTWSSAALVNPPQGSTSCAFWDAFLLTTNEQSGYLSYRSLSVSSNQSGRSRRWSRVDLSHQQGDSIHRPAAHWMFFVFRTNYAADLSKTFVCGNPRRWVVTEMLKPARLAPTIVPRWKSPRRYFVMNKSAYRCSL